MILPFQVTSFFLFFLYAKLFNCQIGTRLVVVVKFFVLFKVY
jgi:hypothetical protein